MAQKTLDLVESHGREDLGKLYRSQVLTVQDEGHLLHGKIPTVRYEPDDPENQGLMESIRELGVLQPCLAWYFQDTGRTHVIFGNRRTIMAGLVSEELLDADKDPILVRYRVEEKKTITPKLMVEAFDLYADENNRRKGNDWLTVIYACHQQKKIGVDIGLILARWPMIESEALLERMIKDSGIIASHADVQIALAGGAIKLNKALRIADLPLDQQVEALTAKPAAKIDARKYLAPKERAELRAQVLAIVAAGGLDLIPSVNAEALRALASKL